MNKLTVLATLALAALAAPALRADLKADLDAAALVQPGDHAKWVQARDRIVALGAPALDDLAKAAAAENWTARGWTRALAAESARLRIAQPELAPQVDNPRGIDPQHYRQTRLAAPVCRRDLARLGTQGVPLLLERWRWTLDARPFSEGETGKAEREELARALLAVPGQLADSRAQFAMLLAMRDDTISALWRQDAAVSYAQCAGSAALETLGMVIDDAQQPLEVRLGCAWALGRVPTAAALDAIKQRLNDARITGGDNGPALTRALVNGISILGSKWGWQARGADEQQTGDAIRKDCALLLVATIKQHPAESAQIADALANVAWQASLGWVQDLSKDTDATQEVRAAALKCMEPLKMALEREK